MAIVHLESIANVGSEEIIDPEEPWRLTNPRGRLVEPLESCEGAIVLTSIQEAETSREGDFTNDVCRIPLVCASIDS